MKGHKSSDEIIQRVKDFNNGILQTTFVEDIVFCEQLFNSTLIHQLPVGFAYYDDQFVLQKCNKTYAKYLKSYTPFNRETAMGMLYFDYKPGVKPYMEDWFCSVRDSRLPDTLYDLEIKVTINLKKNISFWDSHFEPVMDSTGRPHGFLMCCIDRTKRNILSQPQNTEFVSPDSVVNNCKELENALRIFIRTQYEDRRRSESQFAQNILNKVTPILTYLKKSNLDNQQSLLVSLIEKQLQVSISPFSMKLSSDLYGFTATETRVAKLITNGLISKEIAEVLNVSKDCIDFHRYNIRKKLGLIGKKVNLTTYLLNVFKHTYN